MGVALSEGLARYALHPVPVYLYSGCEHEEVVRNGSAFEGGYFVFRRVDFRHGIFYPLCAVGNAVGLLFIHVVRPVYPAAYQRKPGLVVVQVGGVDYCYVGVFEPPQEFRRGRYPGRAPADYDDFPLCRTGKRAGGTHSDKCSHSRSGHDFYESAPVHCAGFHSHFNFASGFHKFCLPSGLFRLSGFSFRANYLIAKNRRNDCVKFRKLG